MIGLFSNYFLMDDISYPYPSTAYTRSIYGRLWQSLGRGAANIVTGAAQKITDDASDFPLIEYSEEEHSLFSGIKTTRGIFKKYHSRIKSAEVYLEDTDTGESRIYKLCEECRLVKGAIQIRFTPEMAPYLLQCGLNWFIEQHAFLEHSPRHRSLEMPEGTIDEESMSILFNMIMNPFYLSDGLDSKYARFYALIRKYRGSVEFPIEGLRDLLLLDQSYKKPSHFFGTYLPSVKKAIEEHYDISFTFTPIKQGRKFARVRFEVKVLHPLKGCAIDGYFLLKSIKGF